MISLSIVIPSYNSEKTLARALEDLDKFSDKIEVIIVNDGSKDRTAEIADALAEEKSYVKVIHQENRGHGGAINAGLKEARGEWFKVLDSDDRLDPQGLEAFFEIIDNNMEIRRTCQMIVMDFVYEFLQRKNLFSEKNKRKYRHKKNWYLDLDGSLYKLKRKNYESMFHPNRISTWEDLKDEKLELILMHALIYKTRYLKMIELKLPEHVCYEDNIFVARPQMLLERFYYLPINLYRYFIGREEQSVSLKSILKNKEKQIIVTKEFYKQVSFRDYHTFGLKRYFIDHAARMLVMAYIPIAMLDGIKRIDEIDNELNTINPKLWQEVKKDRRVVWAYILASFGKRINCMIYKMVFKFLGFK